MTKVTEEQLVRGKIRFESRSSIHSWLAQYMGTTLWLYDNVVEETIKLREFGKQGARKELGTKHSFHKLVPSSCLLKLVPST